MAFTAGMLLSITSGTQASGGHKRYNTALEAGRAGGEIAREMVDARGAPDISALLDAWALPAEAIVTAAPGGDCLRAKFINATNVWSADCSATLVIDPADVTTFDMTFDLGDPLDPPNNYSIYAKIIDTVNGNSGGLSELVANPGVVASHTGEITTMSLPFLYTIEVLAQNAANPLERARLSLLYQF
jgi:hypothetical protein